MRVAETTGLSLILVDLILRFMYKFWGFFESIDVIIHYISGFGLLIWLYSLHVVLKRSFKGYLIRPWGAVTRYIIPFYSLWGIWNIFSTLSNHLMQDRREAVAHKGKKLKQWFLGMYLGMVLSILADIACRFTIISFGERENTPWWFYVVFNTISLVSSTLYLQVFRISHSSVSEQGYQLINSPR